MVSTTQYHHRITRLAGYPNPSSNPTNGVLMGVFKIKKSVRTDIYKICFIVLSSHARERLADI